MAIKDKLDDIYETNQLAKAVFEFRAESQRAYIALNAAVYRLNALVASSGFTAIDQELITEGGAILTIINDAKVALDTHIEFLLWSRTQ